MELWCLSNDTSSVGRATVQFRSRLAFSSASLISRPGHPMSLLSRGCGRFPRILPYRPCRDREESCHLIYHLLCPRTGHRHYCATLYSVLHCCLLSKLCAKKRTKAQEPFSSTPTLAVFGFLRRFMNTDHPCATTTNNV